MMERLLQAFRVQTLVVLSGMALITGLLATGFVVGTASGASAAVEVTVCLKNASTQCADVKDSSNTAGTRIWLYNKASGKDYHWLYVANSNCAVGAVCYYLEDAQKTSLCLSATGTGGAEVKLENCSDAGSWYDEGGNELGNGDFGAGATLIANGSGNGYYLYTNRTGNWHQWTI